MATKKQTESISITCPTCERTRTDRQYYKTKSPKYKNGYICFCKDCIRDYFLESFKRTNDIKVSIIDVCSFADIPFEDKNIIPYTDEDVSNEEGVLKIYHEFLKITSSIGKKLLKTNNFNILPLIEKSMSEEDSEEERLFPQTNLDIEVDDDVIRFFGSGFVYSEYQELLLAYLELVRNFGASDYTKVQQFKDIAYVGLKINQAKARSASEDEVIKLMESRNKLFDKAGLLKLNDKSDTEQLWMGDLIEKFENNKPIFPLPEWEENPYKELTTIVTGHLMKVEGHSNEIVDEYEEIVSPYTVDLIEESEEDGW